VVIGIDGKSLELDASDFQRYVRSHYVAGEQVLITLLRDGQRHDLTLTLRH
jgi:S1-C subfamily serine protease